MPELYTKCRGGKPYEYHFGEEWAIMRLMADGGYPTAEEAVAAWMEDE